MADDLDILGAQVALTLDPSLKDEDKIDKAVATAIAMAKVINAAQVKLTPEEMKSFVGIKQLVLFESKKFEGRTMTRSFMDQKHATFFYEVDEFLAPFQTPERLATYYFHDSWHLQQFLNSGHLAGGEEEVEREVDATRRQIEVGKHLGCDQTLLDFLVSYAEDRAAIRMRIASGIG
jgi:hypothetical protein